MTKNIPDGDQLFTGLTKISYDPVEESTIDSVAPIAETPSTADYFRTIKEEVDAALATAPNGAILGSSYYRMPFSFGVSVWNHYQGAESGFGKWMLKSFGKQPVLMSWVNPELRAQVAQSVLHNHGFFNGQVDFEVVTQKIPRRPRLVIASHQGDYTGLIALDISDSQPRLTA